jgi:hypothetical protein
MDSETELTELETGQLTETQPLDNGDKSDITYKTFTLEEVSWVSPI